MPEKLDRCVRDLKAQGKDDDSAWAICVSSTGEKPHHETQIIQEKVNANRQLPFFNPEIKKGTNKPIGVKSVKGMGGTRIDKDSFLWKDIFDNQLKRNVKEPRY